MWLVSAVVPEICQAFREKFGVEDSDLSIVRGIYGMTGQIFGEFVGEIDLKNADVNFKVEEYLESENSEILIVSKSELLSVLSKIDGDVFSWYSYYLEDIEYLILEYDI